MKLRSIEVVEDRTDGSRCDEGFLRLARLVLRNHYEDGSCSADYPCDVVSRASSDAVVAVLYEIDGERKVRVLLREAPRAPIYLRRHKTYEHTDQRSYDTIRELVAGLIETGDGPDDEGLRRRASIEADEEAGLSAPPESFAVIGRETFASPGIGDEKLFYTAGAARLEERGEARGDGSVMEECSRVVVMELSEAIAACRSGEIPDMKTEVGLLRLADHLGYLPQLGCFADDLPPEWVARHRSLGVAHR